MQAERIELSDRGIRPWLLTLAADGEAALAAQAEAVAEKMATSPEPLQVLCAEASAGDALHLRQSMVDFAAPRGTSVCERLRARTDLCRVAHFEKKEDSNVG